MCLACVTLGKDIVYRVQKNTRQTPFFAECFFALSIPPCLPSAIILPSVFRTTLGKELFCRVLEGLHSANPLALGKLTVSGSEMHIRKFTYHARIQNYGFLFH